MAVGEEYIVFLNKIETPSYANNNELENGYYYVNATYSKFNYNEPHQVLFSDELYYKDLIDKSIILMNEDEENKYNLIVEEILAKYK